MPNRPLYKCPTCRRELDDVTRMAMGLRNGELLNALCPGRCGPSDIDHVIHNKWLKPAERIAFLEYKDGVLLGDGQRMLYRSLQGNWEERDTGRLLEIRYHVLDQRAIDATSLLTPIVDWVWPTRDQQASA